LLVLARLVRFLDVKKVSNRVVETWKKRQKNDKKFQKIKKKKKTKEKLKKKMRKNVHNCMPDSKTSSDVKTGSF